MYKPKVFFTAAFEGKTKYQQYYDLIVQILSESNVELIATELGNYLKLLSKNDLKKHKTDRERHYIAIKNGIQSADMIILELSHESFQVGHEATIALDLNKPVLGLSLHEDWSNRIIHRYFTAAKYNKYMVRNIIQEFIERHSHEYLSERFNLFLSKKQTDKLERLAKSEGLNKSEYIRMLLNKLS